MSVFDPYGYLSRNDSISHRGQIILPKYNFTNSNADIINKCIQILNSYGFLVGPQIPIILPIPPNLRPFYISNSIVCKINYNAASQFFYFSNLDIYNILSNYSYLFENFTNDSYLNISLSLINVFLFNFNSSSFNFSIQFGGDSISINNNSYSDKVIYFINLFKNKNNFYFNELISTDVKNLSNIISSQSIADFKINSFIDYQNFMNDPSGTFYQIDNLSPQSQCSIIYQFLIQIKGSQL